MLDLIAHSKNKQAISNLLTDGYTIVKNAASTNTIASLGSELAPYFTACPTCRGPFSGKNTARFSGLFSKSETAQDLVLDEDILDIAGAILLPNCDRMQVHLTQAIEIKPGEGMQPPHHDDVIFPIDNRGMEFMLNVMWPITPFTVENGATCLWPGTHRNMVSDADLPSIGAPFMATAEPGDAIIWLGSVLHCGGANMSNAARRSIVLSYSLGWLRQAENHYLTYSEEDLRSFPQQLLELLGYVAHRPNLGWVNGNEPLDMLNGLKGLRPATDLLDPISQMRLEEFCKQMQAAEAA